MAHQGQAAGAAVDHQQHALARRPGTVDGVAAHVVDHLIVHPLRRPPQRQFPQGCEVAGQEVMLHRSLRLVRQVDFALVQPLDQVLGGEVDQLDVVRAVDDRVGHRLAHPDAGDSGHHVVQALDVLDVQRGVDVDPGPKQLLDVQVALRVPAAGCVGVGEFVHQHELRVPDQHGVEVHLLHRVAAIFDPAPRDDLQSLQQRQRLLAAMRLGDADHHVHPVALASGGGEQHLVRLADARGGAQEHL